MRMKIALMLFVYFWKCIFIKSLYKNTNLVDDEKYTWKKNNQFDRFSVKRVIVVYIENICPDLWKTRKARRSSSWSKESADQAANCPEMHFPISGDLLAAVLVSRACVRTRRYERTSLCRYFGEWTEGRREYVFDRWITQYSVTLTRGRDEGPRVPCRVRGQGGSAARVGRGWMHPVSHIYTR